MFRFFSFWFFQENFVGIVQTDFSLKKLAHKWAEWCKRLCEHTYGVSPEIEVNGHLNVIFPYIPLPLDYILPELLKNALRLEVNLFSVKSDDLMFLADSVWL